MSKHYTVKVEGTEPFRATREEALAWLWCYKVERGECWIYTARDPGRSYAEDLDIRDFPKKGDPIYDRVMELFRDAEVEGLRSELRGLLDPFRYGDLRQGDDCPISWDSECGHKVELRLDTDFVLRHKRHHYEIGLNTGDDYQSLGDTVHRRQALLIFGQAVAGLYLRQAIAKSAEVSHE